MRFAQKAGGFVSGFFDDQSIRSGLIFGRPVSGLKAGYGWTLKGNAAIVAALTAFEVGAAPKGHMVSTLAGSAARLGGGIIGGAVAGPLGAIAGTIIGDVVGGRAQRAAQSFVELGSRIHRPEMGGNYVDTDMAFTMRQRASQELSGSLMNARQYLGKEAILMHQ